MFLKSQLSTANSCFKFAAQHSATSFSLTSLKLLAKVAEIEEMQAKVRVVEQMKQCPAGHPLVLINGWYCDSELPSCNNNPDWETDRYNCKECDFDYCNACYNI